MKTNARIATGVATAGTIALGARSWTTARRMSRIRHRLLPQREEEVFDRAMVDHLPEPVRRYFRHSIIPGTRLAGSVRLKIEGLMSLRAGACPVAVTADEVLNPSRGFVWTAHLKIGGVPITVNDHYIDGIGAVDVLALGILPAGHHSDEAVAKSSRHRAAAESVWVPSSLLPRSGAAWEAIDDHHARVTVSIDGEAIPLTLRVGEDGRLKEIEMMRYRKEGVDSWQLIPYGFVVEEEKALGGYVIPASITGGWWYGTERYDPDMAAGFEVLEAEYR